MNLTLLVNENDDTLLVVHTEELLKYSGDYKEVCGLCLYKPKEVCAAFAAFFENGVQQRIVLDVKE